MGTNLRLSGYRGDGAAFAALERVNDAALAHVGVADEADRDLLPVGVQLGELTEQLDERALAEGVVWRRVEGQRGVSWCEMLDIPCLVMRRQYHACIWERE